MKNMKTVSAKKMPTSNPTMIFLISL